MMMKNTFQIWQNHHIISYFFVVVQWQHQKATVLYFVLCMCAILISHTDQMLQLCACPWHCVPMFPPGGGSTVMSAIFETFDCNGSLLYASSRSDHPPLSAEKISLFLSNLVPEIFVPKFVLIIHQKVLFNCF